MRIEIETPPYDHSRFQKPWIAVCDFSTNPSGDFKWHQWIGDPGQPGLLIIADVPAGTIVARGQKDRTAPPHVNVPTFYEVAEDGSLAPLEGRVAAYRRFHANLNRRSVNNTNDK